MCKPYVRRRMCPGQSDIALALLCSGGRAERLVGLLARSLRHALNSFAWLASIASAVALHQGKPAKVKKVGQTGPVGLGGPGWACVCVDVRRRHQQTPSARELQHQGGRPQPGLLGAYLLYGPVFFYLDLFFVARCSWWRAQQSIGQGTKRDA